MKSKDNKICKKAFSLAEILAVLVISSMIILTVFGLYGRLNKTSASVTSRLGANQTPREVLELISEDLQRILTDTRDSRITFRNKIESDGTQSARLEIMKFIYDKENNPKIFEHIVWQTAYDWDSSQEGMVLYRRHTGEALEDKLLEEARTDIEKELFIPVCTGVTFFSIQSSRFQSGAIETTQQGREIVINNWNTVNLPSNIIAAISFAEPSEVLPGQWSVPDEKKFSKVIALDRTRKIPFRIAVLDLNYISDLKSSVNKERNVQDVNSIQDINSPK